MVFDALYGPHADVQFLELREGDLGFQVRQFGRFVFGHFALQYFVEVELPEQRQGLVEPEIVAAIVRRFPPRFGDCTLLTEVVPRFVGGARQVGGHVNRQRTAEVQEAHQYRLARLPVLLDQLPRRRLVEGDVARLRQLHQRLQAALEAAGIQRRGHALAGGGDFRAQIGGGAAIGVQPVEEVLVAERDDAVEQVAQRADELVVDAGDVVLPREVGVAVLGHQRRQVVAQRLGVIARQIVGDPDRVASRFRELRRVEQQVLVGGYVMGQVQPRTHEHRGPDDGMERDVVLGQEVVVFCVIVVPPFTPRIGLAALRGPCARSRVVAHHRLEPDVDALALVAVAWHRNTPLHVARHRAVVQPLLEPVARELQHVVAPVLLAVSEPLQQPLAERR